MKRRYAMAALLLAAAAGLTSCSGGSASNDYIKISKYKGVEVPAVEGLPDITDESVENNIQTVLEGFAEVTEVTDRPAQEGDIAVLDYTASADGQEIENGGNSEYELDRNFISLVGGGGSGAVIVNALAEKMKVKCQMAKNAPYISTIGVALAMVREQLERTIANPTDEDIKRIRADVIEKIVRSGAKEDTVDVSIEIDAQKNILRAIATGATELRQKNLGAADLTREEMGKIAADSLGAKAEQTQYICGTGRWNLFEGQLSKKMLGGLIKLKRRGVAVVDREGVVRLRKEQASYVIFPKGKQKEIFNHFLDDNTTYSDANCGKNYQRASGIREDGARGRDSGGSL